MTHQNNERVGRTCTTCLKPPPTCHQNRTSATNEVRGPTPCRLDRPFPPATNHTSHTQKLAMKPAMTCTSGPRRNGPVGMRVESAWPTSTAQNDRSRTRARAMSARERAQNAWHMNADQEVGTSAQAGLSKPIRSISVPASSLSSVEPSRLTLLNSPPTTPNPTQRTPRSNRTCLALGKLS